MQIGKKCLIVATMAMIFVVLNVNFSAAAKAQAATGPFATKAKVEIEDANGKLTLKREEEIAYMFMSAIEWIEQDCMMNLKRACTLKEVLVGSKTPGAQYQHLKFDPNAVDPNYTYTLWAGGMAYEAHANPKKPGLGGFCMMARSIGSAVATYNAKGLAGWTSDELRNRGVEGDTFTVQ